LLFKFSITLILFFSHSAFGHGLQLSFGGSATLKGVTYIFGGYSPKGMESEVFTVKNCGKRIERVIQNQRFSPRSFFPNVVYDNSVWIFGGFEFKPPSNVLGDVLSASDGLSGWKIEAADPSWESREAHGAVLHRNQFYIFWGG